jgi:hypothetical protein
VFPVLLLAKYKGKEILSLSLWAQQEHLLARHWWLTTVILASQEAEIRRITV